MTKPEIKSLTGLRGIAATLVMLDHYAAIDFSYPFPFNMLPHMYLAVDMFMILSGFILSMTYKDRLSRFTPASGYRFFIVRRVARLYPLYAFTTVVCFGLCRLGWLTFLNPDASPAALLANLLAVQTWFWPGSSLNGPGWSISTEWFASLVFPFLVPVILGRSSARAACVAGLALAVLALSAVLFGQLFDVPSPGAVNIISGPQALGRCLSEFLIGMYCWRLRSGSLWTYVLRRDLIQIVLFIVLLMLIQDASLDVISVVVCALLLVGLSFETSVCSGVLRLAPVLFLGRISYSIYLLHIALMPLRDELAQVFERQGIPGAWWFAVSCCVVTTVVLASLTYRYVEHAMQKAILASFTKRTTRSAF